MKLKVSEKFSLPLEAATDAIAIVGRRGRGKTTTAVVLVEEIHNAGGRFVVADPVGVWWGLKSTRNGKGKGIPVIVMGGEHADVPLEETSGKVIADFVIDPTNPSVVLDFRGFRKAQMTRFMVDFLEQLYHKNRQPLHVVLDEADQFAPQRVMGETARMVGACEDVCKMGRARGLSPILITQRPAALNKNVLTQAGLLITHQLTGPQDRKALDEWIRANAEEAERVKFIETVPTLGKGVAWFWQPEHGTFQIVHVRDRHTYDSSSTPKGGATHGPKVQADVDLDALKAKIAATIEKAKQTDPKELQRTIADLRKQLAAKPVPVIQATTAPKVVKVKAFTDAQVKRLETLFERMIKEAERHGAAMSEFWKNQNEVGDAFMKALQSVAHDQHGYQPPKQPMATVTPIRRAKIEETTTAVETEGSLTGPEQRIVDAVAFLNSVGNLSPENAAVAFVAGYSYKGSAYRNPRSALVTKGLIRIANDVVHLTPSGAAVAVIPETTPTNDELHGRVMHILGGPERKILKVLLDTYPNTIANDILAEKAGYSAAGSAYRNPRSRLKSLGLIEVMGGDVRARDILFPL
jgi:uncharacterized protein